MKARLAVMLLVLGFVSSVRAQETTSPATLSLKRAGIGFSYIDMYTAPYVRESIGLSGFVDLSLKDPVRVRLQSQVSHAEATVHSGDYSFSAATFDAIVLTKVTKISALGMGLGGSWMRFQRHSVVTMYGDASPTSAYKETIDLDERLLRPTLIAVATSEWSLIGSANMEVSLSYRWTFLGKYFVNHSRYNVSSGPLNSMMSWGATVYVSFDLAK